MMGYATGDEMLEIAGEVVEMGSLENDCGIGIVIRIKDGSFITLSGLQMDDLRNLPNILFRDVRLTLGHNV